MEARKELSFLDVLVLLLSGYVLAQLCVEAILPMDESVRTIFNYGDYVVSAVFLTDFAARFVSAPSKLAFMKWGWIDLLSSLPTCNWLMLSRFARVVRLLRLIRALRSIEVLLKVIFRNRIRNSFLIVIVVASLMIVSCASVMLSLERGVKDANITTAGDALWWATTTATTVGYGDKYPVTAEGRIVAVVLMITGVGLFSTFSGTVAAILLKSNQSEASNDTLLEELRALRSEVERLSRTAGTN